MRLALTLSFFVPGLPRTKGSAKAFIVQGKARITNDNTKAKPWQHAIAWEAQCRRGGKTSTPPTTGPVELFLRYFLPRPKSHFKKDGTVRSAAPSRPTTKPDVDKMERIVLDALTGIVYLDDAQVVAVHHSKHYAGEIHGVGIAIEVTEEPAA